MDKNHPRARPEGVSNSYKLKTIPFLILLYLRKITCMFIIFTISVLIRSLKLLVATKIVSYYCRLYLKCNLIQYKKNWCHKSMLVGLRNYKSKQALTQVNSVSFYRKSNPEVLCYTVLNITQIKSNLFWLNLSTNSTCDTSYPNSYKLIQKELLLIVFPTLYTCYLKPNSFERTCLNITEKVSWFISSHLIRSFSFFCWKKLFSRNFNWTQRIKLWFHT